MAPHAEDTLILNNKVYQIAPGSYQVEDMAAFPQPVRDGTPSYDTLAHESVVAWDDWQDGGGEVLYREPARYYNAQNVITDIPHQLTLSYLQRATSGLLEAPTKLAQLRPNDPMVALSTARLYSKSTTTDDWTALFTGTPTDVVAWGNSSGEPMYLIARGSSTAYVYSTALGSAWTTSTLTSRDAWADFFAVGPKGTGSSGGTLWKALKPNRVYATDDPSNAGHWSAAYEVGGSETNITGLAVLEDRLIVAKEEGLYWVQPSGTVQPLVDFRGAVDAENGKALTAWGGYTFANWAQGLYQLSGRNLLNVGEVTAAFRDVGPHVGSQAGADARGKVVALCPTPTRLYAVLQSETGNYSVNRYNGDTRPGFGWNLGFLWLSTNACDAIGWEVPASGNPRLYFGYGASARYVVMPRFGDNPLLDSGVSFAPSGTVEMAEYESRLKAMSKSMLYTAVELERTSAGARYVDVAYKLDDDGTGAWQTLRRIDADGLTKAYFSTTETGRRIKLQLTLASTTSSNSPRVRTLEHHYELRPARRQRWSFGVVAAQGTRSHPTRTAKNIRDDLVAARDSVQPVPLEDALGGLWDVFVDSVSEIQTAKLPGAPEPALLVSVTAKEFKSGVGAFYVDAEEAVEGKAYAA